MGNKKNSTTGAVSPEARKSLIALSCVTILTLYVHTALAPALPNITLAFSISYDLALWVLTVQIGRFIYHKLINFFKLQMVRWNHY
jgi:hypothetical protein